MIWGIPFGFLVGWQVAKLNNGLFRWNLYLSLSFLFWTAFLIGFSYLEYEVYNLPQTIPAPGTMAMGGYLSALIVSANWKRAKIRKSNST